MMLNREQIAGFFFLLFDESFEFKGYKKVKAYPGRKLRSDKGYEKIREYIPVENYL